MEAIMGRHWQAALALAFAGCAGVAAHAQTAAQKPAIVVGDSWEFKATSMPDGKTSEWSRTVVEIAPNDALKVRMQDGKVFDYDGTMNSMPNGSADSARILVRYPLKVGDEWKLVPTLANPNASETGKAKVVAFEAITVPAGTFQCYVVEAEAYREGARGRAKEDRSWKRWYCPDVKWIAKEVLQTRIHGTTGRPESASVETSELVKYTPGK